MDVKISFRNGYNGQLVADNANIYLFFKHVGRCLI